MKKFYDILCKALFMSIALGITTYVFPLIINGYWYNDLLWKIGNLTFCRFSMVVVILGLYYLSKAIIWKAVTHFNTK